ncbi:hypothetical protein [Mesorhizobium sp. M1406]|uniref:hypothetical protein n=1 Tax=Mesorhizobium sp. M1406 TaxID=2957099 RepID=UPI0033375A1B
MSAVALEFDDAGTRPFYVPTVRAYNPPLSPETKLRSPPFDFLPFGIELQQAADMMGWAAGFGSEHSIDSKNNTALPVAITNYMPQPSGLHPFQIASGATDFQSWASRLALVPVSSGALAPANTNYGQTTTAQQSGAFPNIAAPVELKARAAMLWNSIEAGTRTPSVWADEGEIAFEWKWGDRHAILSLEEDGAIGYAMYSDGQFFPGGEVATQEKLPQDLLNYLSMK